MFGKGSIQLLTILQRSRLPHHNNWLCLLCTKPDKRDPTVWGSRAMAAGYRTHAAKDEQETSAAAATATNAVLNPPPKWGSKLYEFAVKGQPRPARLAAWTIIFMVMLARSWRLFKRELAVLGVVELLLCHVLGARVALGGSLALVVLALVDQARRVPEAHMNMGHRAGAEGYDRAPCENTIESLTALAQLDRSSKGGNLLSSALPYVEIDVQETADRQLVVLHDLHLRRAFPAHGINVAALEVLRGQGVDIENTTVQELTLAQLQSLHLGAHEGMHVPTLRAFMEAYKACGIARPLVVEVKLLQTDAGRAKLIEELRWFKPYAEQLAAQFPERCHPRFRFLAVISFPHLYAASFGEFDSPSCRRWTQEIGAAGVPVRCCILETLSFAYRA